MTAERGGLPDENLILYLIKYSVMLEADGQHEESLAIHQESQKLAHSGNAQEVSDYLAKLRTLVADRQKQIEEKEQQRKAAEQEQARKVLAEAEERKRAEQKLSES